MIPPNTQKSMKNRPRGRQTRHLTPNVPEWSPRGVKASKKTPKWCPRVPKWRPGDPKIEVLDEKYNGQGASVLSFRIATKRTQRFDLYPKTTRTQNHYHTTTSQHHCTTTPQDYYTTTPLHQTPNTTNTQQQHTTHFPLLV